MYLNLIEARLAGRPRLPSPMNPVPMVGMTTDGNFERPHQPLRVLAYRRLALAVEYQINRRHHDDPMAQRCTLAHDEGGHHREPGHDREPRQAVVGRGRHREEIDECAV